MKFIYTPNKTDIIIYHENKILEEYSRIIKKYSNMFEQYDCSLEVRCFWHNCIQKKKSASRLPFQNGYSCYIYCDVFKSGDILCYKTNDGEADYYEASAFWTVSSISKSFFNLKVTLYTMLDDIDCEMMQLLEIAQHNGEGDNQE